jgi:protease-4
MSNDPLQPGPSPVSASQPAPAAQVPAATVSQPLPAAHVPPAPPPSSGGFPILGCFFAISFVLNILLGVLLLIACMGFFFRAGSSDASSGTVTERHHSGKRTASDKVAIVALDGPILDGIHGQLEREIDRAAEDDHVKAVVFRVNSPGGSITASDDIMRRLRELRDGDKDKGRSPKPLIVSMGGVAASGGYYVSMPGQFIFAEPTTITGSIGVYYSVPNLTKFGENHGVGFKTIKAGKLKAIGAMFRDMTKEEEEVMQDMVDDAYVRFLDVVKTGRPKLTREKMLERFDVKPLNPDPEAAKAMGRDPNPKPYTRYRADGAIFTAKLALEKQLIDKIGSLDDAIAKAAQQANLSEFRAVKYRRLPLLAELLLNSRAPETSKLSLGQLQPMLTPRLWYLTPGYEAAVRLSEAQR